MINRRTLLGVAAGAAAVAVLATTQLTGGSFTPAIAGEKAAFEAAAFHAAQVAGKPILVDIRASWCITCARQRPIISKLSTKPKFKDLVIFEVDYDRQKSVVRDFGAWRQSTLIVFKGTTEVGRSVADTRPASIEALLDLTI